ncbi:MAG: DciA family protein [Pseudomonadota bacterium]|nr:DciA family protein [Pseudomonadota bacterium]
MWKRRLSKIPRSRPLADHVQIVIDPVLRRQGFGQSGLVLFWDDIVGERLAAMSQPVKVQWPVRQHGGAAENDRAPATLIVRVETGFALELQHLAPNVIERVNAHFGWRCVSRLLLKQGPVAAPPLVKHEARPLDKAAEAAAETIVGSVMDEPLRLALTRLGARVLAGLKQDALACQR